MNQVVPDKGIRIGADKLSPIEHGDGGTSQQHPLPWKGSQHRTMLRGCSG
jgi:hypothetical protein